jgi:hypothetical protein
MPFLMQYLRSFRSALALRSAGQSSGISTINVSPFSVGSGAGTYSVVAGDFCGCSLDVLLGDFLLSAFLLSAFLLSAFLLSDFLLGDFLLGDFLRALVILRALLQH